MHASHTLQTGDILHCKGTSFLSRAIRFFTKSDFTNHTAVVVMCWGEPFVVDAQKNGVNPKPLEEWLREYEYEIIVARPMEPPRTQLQVRAFSLKAFSKIGLTGYDYASLIWRHPWSVLTGEWFLDKNPNDKMVCSEYVAWLFDIEKPYRITPKKLLDYTNRNDFFHFRYTYVL